MGDRDSKRPKRYSRKAIIISVGITVMVMVGLIIIMAIIGKNELPNDGATSGGTSDSPATDTITQPSLPPCTSYQAIDAQTWLEVVKDPDSYKGKCYTVYGEVTQFDAATGTSDFRADVGGVQQTPSYGFVNYPTNTVLVGDPTTLKDVVNQDLFTANVMVLGSYSYTTSLGGQLTVPQLQVDSITVTGSLSS